jgi:hypothetical protein
MWCLTLTELTKPVNTHACFRQWLTFLPIDFRLHGGLTAAGICIDEPLIEADWNTSRKQIKGSKI